MYTCVATNSAGSANRSVALTILGIYQLLIVFNEVNHAHNNFLVFLIDPPHIVGETVTELIVNVGDVVRLPCNASGEPTPEYIWSFNYEFMNYNDHM